MHGGPFLSPAIPLTEAKRFMTSSGTGQNSLRIRSRPSSYITSLKLPTLEHTPAAVAGESVGHRPSLLRDG